MRTLWINTDMTRMTIDRHTGMLKHGYARQKTLYSKVCSSPAHAKNYAKKVGANAWVEGNVVKYFI